MKIKFIVHLTNKFFATCDAQLIEMTFKFKLKIEKINFDTNDKSQCWNAAKV
jgi:hypothetical protein